MRPVCSGGAGGSAGIVHIAGVYGGYPAGVTRASFPNPLAIALQPVAAAAAAAAGPGEGKSESESDLDWVSRAGIVLGPSRRAAAAAAAAPPPGLGYAGSALDLSAPAYYARWTVPGCGPTAMLQAKSYAHRKHRALLVLELEAFNATVGCTVRLASCAGRPGLVTELGPGLYQVTSPEQPFDPAFPRVTPPVTAIASTPVPPTVALGPGRPPALFLAVFRTTLEPDVANATVVHMAKAELAARTAVGATGLWAVNMLGFGA